LLDGVVYTMSPAPSKAHQRVLVELSRQVANSLKGHPCSVFISPFSVRLPERDETADTARNAVHPDLLIVCDEKNLDDAGCVGAPDFVVEILSPSTAAIDQIQKLRLYERHGVKEYWILHPIDEILYVRLLGPDGVYGAPTVFSAKGTVELTAVDGVTVDLVELFEK